MIDDCGVCQSAYLYDYVTHVVTMISDTAGVVAGPTEMIVMPNSPSNPYWNSSCTIDCNGVVNGLAMVDDCGVCQSALVYDITIHVATPITDTTGYVFGPTEFLVMPMSFAICESLSCGWFFNTHRTESGLSCLLDSGTSVSYTHLTLPTTPYV